MASKIPIMFQNSLGLRDNDAHDVPVRVVTKYQLHFNEESLALCPLLSYFDFMRIDISDVCSVRTREPRERAGD